MTHESPPPGEQPERRPQPDAGPAAPGAEPKPAVSGRDLHDDVDDENYDPEHFEDL